MLRGLRLWGVRLIWLRAPTVYSSLQTCTGGGKILHPKPPATASGSYYTLWLISERCVLLWNPSMK